MTLVRIFFEQPDTCHSYKACRVENGSDTMEPDGTLWCTYVCPCVGSEACQFYILNDEEPTVCEINYHGP